MEHQLCILSGSSNHELAYKISDFLQVPLTGIKIRNFGNSEIDVIIEQNIRNKNVFIIQSACSSKTKGKSVNDMIIELMLIINACILSSATNITVIMPIFPYSRSDKKMVPGSCIGASVIAKTIENSGAKHFISLDLHSGQIQGFVSKPFDNLYTTDLFIEFLKKELDFENHLDEYLLVSPDNGGLKRIQEYSEKMKLNYVTIHKQRDVHQVSVITNTLIVGDLQQLVGKTAIIVDDIVDTMGTMVAAVNDLSKYGTKDVIIIATHGVFSEPAIERIEQCEMIKNVIVTNSIPQIDNQKRCSKIMVVDISAMLGEMIRNISEK